MCIEQRTECQPECSFLQGIDNMLFDLTDLLRILDIVGYFSSLFAWLDILCQY